MASFVGRRVRLPPLVPRIDRRHPLAQGLVACYLPSTAPSGTIFNLAGDSGHLTTRGAGGLSTSPEGLALNGRATGQDYAYAAAPTAFQFAIGVSLFVRGQFLGVTTGGGPDLIGVTFNNAGGSPFAAYALSNTSSGIEAAFNIAGSGSFVGATSFAAGTLVSAALTLAPSLHRYFVNGVLKTNNTTAGTISYGTSPFLCFNASAPNPANFASNFAPTIACIWGRALSDAEVLALHNDPYGFLEAPWERLPMGSIAAHNLTGDSWAPLEWGASFDGAAVQLEGAENLRVDPTVAIAGGGGVRVDPAVPAESGRVGVTSDRLAPLEIAANLRADPAVAIAGGSSLQVDPVVPAESGRLGVTGDRLAQLEAAANLRADPAVAITGGSSLQVDPAVPAEAASGLRRDHLAAGEALLRTTADALPSSEAGAALTRDAAGPVEFLLLRIRAQSPPDEFGLVQPQMLVCASAPVEWLLMQLRGGAPVESAALYRAEETAPGEGLASGRVNPSSATEYAAMFSYDGILPLAQSSQASRAETTAPAEVLTSQARDAGAPIEALLSRALAGAPIEILGLFQIHPAVAAEAAASSRSEGQGEVEALLATIREQLAAVEAPSIARMDPPIAAEWAALFRADPHAATEALLARAVSRASIAIEVLYVARMDPPAAAEWVAALRADRSAAAETPARLAGNQAVPLEAPRVQTADPVSNTYVQIEAGMTPPPPLVYVARDRLRKASDILGGHARAFGSLAAGASDWFAFDFTAQVGAAAITLTSWTCRLRPLQSVADPQPQAHILAPAEAETRIGIYDPADAPGWQGVASPPQGWAVSRGSYSVALVGGFTAAEAGAVYELAAAVTTSDGRTLITVADLAVQS